MLVAACLALAALSLLFPSSPTYDPWAWVIWGREILHGHLSTTDGPSWKPLPVVFTTPFALFGSAAPALWLVVARAGGLAAVALAFVVARRLAGVVAGAAAAGGFLIAPWLLRNVALGNSEGLLTAAVLAAVERHISGRRHQALLLALAAALLRPEAWAFFGLYAAWLLWRERRAALPLVAAATAAVPVLWLVPERLGSGSFTRAADRAQQPLKGSPAYLDDPAGRVVRQAADMVTWPVWVGLGLALLWIVARRVDRPRALTALGLAAIAAGWTGIVAYMTTRGYSGNVRYVITPVLLLVVAGAAGIGWTLQPVLERLPARAALTAAAAIGVAALFLTQWSGTLSPVLDGVRYQGRLPHRLDAAVDAAGGAARVKRCGGLATGPFQVTAVAWRLGVPIHDVAYEPHAPTAILRTRTNPGSKLVPALDTLGGATTRTLAASHGWQILETCG